MKRNVKYICYFDASVLFEEKKASISFLIKGRKGQVLFWRASEIDNIERPNRSEIAECLALNALLRFALKYNLDGMVIRGDCKSMIEKIQNNISDKRYYRNLIKLMERFDDIQLEWIPRSKNYMADNLCERVYKMGNSQMKPRKIAI